jgi:hypothetical protein
MLAMSSNTEIHLVNPDGNRVIATLPPLASGGCEVTCPPAFQNAGDNWDFRLAFSPDGGYISLVQNGIDSQFQVWSLEGKEVVNLNASGQTMSVWSGGNLYFRDSKGVEIWHAGTVSSFLPGVSWIRPKASPRRGQIVYGARDAQGSTHVFVVNTTTGQVRDLGKGHVDPVFLTDRYVWYAAEPAGKTYIYDLQTGTESESIITGVYDVWPHAA